MAGIVSAICAYMSLANTTDSLTLVGQGPLVVIPCEYDFSLITGIMCCMFTIDSLFCAFKLYTNRRAQMAICLSSALLAFVLTIVCLPMLVAGIMMLLGYRGVRADERLIRSIDRIR